MASEGIIYVQRPDGTSLWLPEIMAHYHGLKRGDRMTQEQYDDHEIQSLIAARRGPTGASTKKRK